MKRYLLSVSILGLGNAVAYGAQYQNHMNIILILVDDFGYECVEANGGGYVTPNINRLAENGVQFTNCYSNPLSTPSRVQLMTGKYNVRNYTAFAQLDRNEVTFANLLQKSGYVTCIAGKWQLGSDEDAPRHFGFDKYCLWQHTQKGVDVNRCDTRYARPIIDIDGTTTFFSSNVFGPDIFCDYVLDFIRDNKERPFLVYYPMVLTHSPFVSTPDSEKWYPERSRTYRGDTKYFPDMVKYADKLVGRIIDELEKLSLKGNTLIIFTGDNGTSSAIVSLLNGQAYRGGKGKTIDSGTHVPLIVCCPKGKRNEINSNLIDFTDFLPTICEAAGIGISSLELDGISFFPQLRNDIYEKRHWVYCWYSPQQANNENAIVFARTHQYKLYRSGDFYDVKADFDEKKPIVKKKMTKEQEHIYNMLFDVINRYEKYAMQK